MRACIHRGAREVGGSCVELEHDGSRIVVDLGLPLTTGMDAVPSLPSISGLTSEDPSLLGIVVSHGHPDHWGLVPHVHHDAPVFVGEATQRILREAAFFAPAGAELRATGCLRDHQPFVLGPFTITPFLADHSSYDAYSLLIEAGGRRLFYSGDVRAHGRKRMLFERLVREPLPAVNALMLEGTHIRAQATGASPSELEIEDELTRLFRATDGLALVCYSPQNIDRLVTVFKAARRAGRTLVLDLYAATIARATGNPSIPQADWADVLVYVPRSQRIRVKRSGQFERVAAITKRRLFAEQLAERSSDLVMTFRGSMAIELEQAGCLRHAQCAWSMWPGYLEDPSGRRLRTWLDEREIPLTVLHSSGHASVNDLQRLAAGIDADRVIPIHTEAPHLYAGLFPAVEQHDDCEWWTV